MDFLLAIALGLAGSLHCAAMCGPLMLALPPTGRGTVGFLTGRLLYQAGRITTYCLLGAAAGVAGKTAVLAGAQRSLSIALGVAILLGLLLSRKISLAAPVAALVGRLKRAMSAQLQQRSLRSLVLLGVLNGWLPCGLVYVAAAGAAARASVSGAVIYMALFGLGTLPTMLAIGLAGKMFPAAVRLKLRTVIPAGVCLVAGLLILRGLGLGIPYLSPEWQAGGPACCVH